MTRIRPPAGVPKPVLLLDRTTISAQLTIPECIRAVEAAFGAHARGLHLPPGLLHVDAEKGEFHVKAGGLTSGHTYFVCKINGGFFGNRAINGLPNIVGLIVLCDGLTGAPLAVMESGCITRLRTGAATAVAAKFLARADSRMVTICGAGTQAEIQLRALAHVLPIEHAYIWSRTGAPSFEERLGAELGFDVEPTRDLATAARRSDVIVTCTPAKRWYLGRDHVSPGTFVAAIGCDSPEKQEIEPALMAESSVVPDLTQQAACAGDLHHAIAAGLMKPSDVRGELGAIVIGAAPRRANAVETIVFDSTGTAIQDAAAAATVYERVAAGGGAATFAFWD